MKDGGCTILNKWLADAKGLDNLPLIMEVLEVCVHIHFNSESVLLAACAVLQIPLCLVH